MDLFKYEEYAYDPRLARAEERRDFKAMLSDGLSKQTLSFYINPEDDSICVRANQYGSSVLCAITDTQVILSKYRGFAVAKRAGIFATETNRELVEVEEISSDNLVYARGCFKLVDKLDILKDVEPSVVSRGRSPMEEYEELLQHIQSNQVSGDIRPRINYVDWQTIVNSVHTIE